MNNKANKKSSKCASCKQQAGSYECMRCVYNYPPLKDLWERKPDVAQCKDCVYAMCEIKIEYAPWTRAPLMRYQFSCLHEASGKRPRNVKPTDSCEEGVLLDDRGKRERQNVYNAIFDD